MQFTVRKIFKPCQWETEEIMSQQALQEEASWLFNHNASKIQAGFYLKHALKKNGGRYHSKYWFIEIRPII